VSFVLDASVTVAWCFADEGGAYAEGALESLRKGESIVPHLWGLEVANALLTAERKGRITASQASQFVKLFLSLPIVMDPVSRARALTTTHRLARTHGLTSYDAAYLELAARHGLPLATLDGALAAAAEREGVGHWGPD